MRRRVGPVERGGPGAGYDCSCLLSLRELLTTALWTPDPTPRCKAGCGGRESMSVKLGEAALVMSRLVFLRCGRQLAPGEAGSSIFTQRPDAPPDMSRSSWR